MGWVDVPLTRKNGLPYTSFASGESGMERPGARFDQPPSLEFCTLCGQW